MTQRYEGTPAVLERFDTLVGADTDLRSELERWRLRFQLLSVCA